MTRWTASGSFAASANDGGDHYGHTYEFAAAVLGALPTHVGIVWTEGSTTASTLFEAFGPSGESLGTVGPAKISDNSFAGTSGEDHFFGVIHPAGISKIVLRNPGGNNTLEIDHLQYGIATGSANDDRLAGGGGWSFSSGMGLFVEPGGVLGLFGSKATPGAFNFRLLGPEIADDAFHHVAATWTGDTTPDGVRLYLDGELSGTATAIAPIDADRSTLQIGGHAEIAYYRFAGLIDEPTVYSRVLSSSEVARIYNQGSAGKIAVDPGNGGDGVHMVNSRGNLVGGVVPGNAGGGPGPEQSTSAGAGDLLHIGTSVLDVYSYHWAATTPFEFGEPAAGAAQPGLFEVTTSRLQAGGLFVDLAEGRSLGDIVLTSTDERTGQLYQSWALENARVVHYRTADPLRVDLAFGFDAIESTTVSFEGGRPDVQQTSRWEMGGATPVISGGGPGPYQSASAGAGDLLHIGEHVLDVSSYHWGAAAPVDFGGASSRPARPTVFDVTIPLAQGAGLFADLAEGRSLGDITVTSTDERTGQLYQLWTLENARVVHYGTGLDAPDTPLSLQLAFGFDAIEATTVAFGPTTWRRAGRWATSR